MTDAAHQTGSVEISFSLRKNDERNDRFTTAITTAMNIGECGTISTTMPVFENEDNETLATLSNSADEAIVNELTASNLLPSTSTSPSFSSQSSVPTKFYVSWYAKRRLAEN
ncbi:hypothetical protein HPULCUR_004527 [Helicostylum pulchrum]|uniref:Uncharacterized protein n=1 Tax=Helicostylum pulchrum TaxID=562976 RepID=A0ABP9XXV5_9FUNG